MKLNKFLAMLTVVSTMGITSAHAGETWDSVKLAASNVANKTAEVAGDVADRTREVAVDVADRTREVAGDAVDRGREVGQDISNSKAWKKAKEVGNATAQAAKNGANKAKGYVNSHACDKQDKLNCNAE